MLARTTDLDTLRRHRTKYVEPLSQAQLLLFSSSIIMNEAATGISQEELAGLQKQIQRDQALH